MKFSPVRIEEKPGDEDAEPRSAITCVFEYVVL